MFLFFLSFYWTAQVIANVVHVTAAGAVATWYFLAPNNMPPGAVRGAFKRAMWNSFGSICFGSFIVAVIQAIRAMVESQRGSENGFVRCLVLCILRCIENMLNYFNIYAFTRVAIYGDSYCKAAKDTWALFMNRGLTMLINDDLTGGVMMLACFFAGLMAMIVVMLVAYTLVTPLYMVIWGLVALLVGYALTLCAVVVVRSGVATIFVCLADDPAALAQTKPEHYQRFADAWKQIYNTDFRY
jgi:hypothetical protein